MHLSSWSWSLAKGDYSESFNSCFLTKGLYITWACSRDQEKGLPLCMHFRFHPNHSRSLSFPFCMRKIFATQFCNCEGEKPLLFFFFCFAYINRYTGCRTSLFWHLSSSPFPLSIIYPERGTEKIFFFFFCLSKSVIREWKGYIFGGRRN